MEFARHKKESYYLIEIKKANGLNPFAFEDFIFDFTQFPGQSSHQQL